MREWYQKKYDWFTARPRALAILCFCSSALTRAVYAGYIGACAVLFFRQAWPVLARFMAVPAAVFLLGTALRAGLNRPRPYEVLGVPPLVDKHTPGKSFPSRHVFCAAVIGLAFAWLRPVLGAVFTFTAVGVALCRVLVGVHWPRDVLAGLAFGWLCGWLGFFAF